jgi:flagellar biosynthesis/type III secretory pathway protein FliH
VRDFRVGERTHHQVSGRCPRLAAAHAAKRLDDPQGKLYFDLVTFALPADAREEFKKMPATHEYLSDFAKKYVAEGVEKGLEQGLEKGRATLADLIARQLTLRFGPLSDAILKRLATSSIEQLDAIGERLLSAESLKDVFPARAKRSR